MPHFLDFLAKRYTTFLRDTAHIFTDEVIR